MTIQQEAAAALAVLERARSLFGPAATAPAPGTPLQSAAQATVDAGQRMGEQSGQLVDRHAAVVARQNRDLTGAVRTDGTLETHLSGAAAITQSGARRMDAILAQTRSIAALAGSAQTPGAERAVLTALRSQIAQTQEVMTTTQQQATEAAGQVRALNYGPGTVPEAPAHDLPTAPPKAPAHGEDPRYWLDVTKIQYVPEGQLAPSGYMQVGPGLWYPDPNRYEVMPAPPPAKYPLDVGDIRVVQPGQLFPHGYEEIAPNIGVPHPDRVYDVQPPWGPPQQPIDIRDVIEVPEGQLAPWGYVEYFPGWWVPEASPGLR